MVASKLKFSALALALAVSAIGVAVPESSATGTDTIGQMRLVRSNGFRTPLLSDGQGGSISVSANTATKVGDSAGSNLPSSFDLRKQKSSAITAVRDQGSWGICWAISATTTGAAALGTAPTLSAKHLAYAAYGVLGQSPTSGHPMQEGGSYSSIIGAWSNYWGPRLESAFPYPKGSDAGHIPTAAEIDTRDYFLDSAVSLAAPYTPAGAYVSDATRAVKQWLYQNGPVTVSLEAPDYSRVATYRASHGTGYTNHMVTIVGWDDSYAASNFGPDKPAVNGAWIIQQSWGTSAGKGGYQYVSYRDKTISGFEGYALTTNGYSINQSYAVNADIGLYLPTGTRTLYAANIYAAEANQSLEAVMIGNATQGNSYKVYIYEGVGTNPMSGTMVATASATNADFGIKTLKLSQAVPLQKGERFSVVVEYTLKNVNGMGPFAETEKLYSGSTLIADVPASARVQTGQSMLSRNGANWTDLTTAKSSGYTLGNLVLVALSGATTMTASSVQTETRKVVDAVRAARKTIYIEQGTSMQLNFGAFLNNKLTSEKITYSTSNTKALTVSSKGKIKAKAVTKKTKVTLTARAASKSLKLTVYVVPKAKKLVSVKASAPSKMKVGQVAYVRYNAGTATNIIVSLSVSNKKLASIDKYGRLTAKKKGTVKIVLKAGKKVFTKTVKIS
ncbi:MAG: lectin like domain-containing protein [Propionibacteriaceae bacterium]|nr:lectin like domain-containing protein [Propionibacteriaceae bacterium]